MIKLKIENKLLKRQIRRLIGDEDHIPEHMIPFIEAVEKSYMHYEEDRKLLERSMELSSEELEEANSSLKEESDRNNSLLFKLRESIKELSSIRFAVNEDAPVNEAKAEEGDDLLKIADVIKMQTKQIKEVEERLLLIQSLIDQSKDSLLIASEDGTITYVNEAVVNSLGFEKSEIINNKIKDFDKVFKTDEDWNNHIETLKANPDGVILEGENERKDGVCYPIEVSARYMDFNGQGYVMAVSRDITERKKAEEQRILLIEDLESLNQELKDFAYVVSHDLKAPLRGIETIAHYIKTDYADKLDDTGKKYLNLLSQRVMRMFKLIDGILKYSKADKSTNDERPIDCSALINEITAGIETERKFDIEIKSALPTVVFEETKLKQIFQNLISNAIKYNNKGDEGKLEIYMDNEHPGFLSFNFKDNGAGIEEKYHKKIFEIFQTLVRKDEYNSTGVGLSIVKKIIDRAKGKIWIESEKDKFTNFKFILPESLKYIS